MFLMIRKQKGIQYLHMMESVYNRKTGKSEKKYIKSFGRYDKLSEEVKKDLQDTIAKKEFQKNVEEKVRAALLLDSLNKQINRDTSDDGAGESVDANVSFEFCYGHLVLKPIWENELGLKYKLSKLQADHTDVSKWSINDLLFYLSATKLLGPQSYLKCSQTRTNYFYCPWGAVSQDNFYRTLDFVYEHRDAIIKHAVRTHMNRSGRQVKLAFFDCTNSWFDAQSDDVVLRSIRYARECRNQLRNDGLTEAEIDAFMASDEYKNALQQELDLSSEDSLGMKGMSKEERDSQPIVSIALAVDDTGFPIDCAVFSGNVSELHQVEPMIHSLQSKYGLKDSYFVADRRLNSTEVIDMVHNHNLGFMVEQKVSEQTKSVIDEMLDLSGYKNYEVTEDGSFVEASGRLDLAAPRFKVCDHTKEAYVSVPSKVDPSRSTRKKISVKCKIVYTFSPERQAKDLADLNALVQKAQKAVDENRLISNSDQGWRSLVKTIRDEDALDGKKSKEQFRAIGTKSDVIENLKTIAGYSSLVFEHPDSEDAHAMSDTQVLNAYHKLVNIEASFRAMNSSLNVRPTNFRLKERITANYYLCLLALMMMHHLQERLALNGVSMSARRIGEALASAKVLPLTYTKGEIYFRNVRGSSKFYSEELTAKSSKQEMPEEVTDQSKGYASNSKQSLLKEGDTQLVLNAAGFAPIPLNVEMKKLKRLLKITKTPNEVVIAPEHMAHIKETLGN